MENILSPAALFKFLEAHSGNRNAFLLNIYLNLNNEGTTAAVVLYR